MNYQELYHEAQILWSSIKSSRGHVSWPKFITKFIINPTPYGGLADQELRQQLLNSKVSAWMLQISQKG